MEHAIEFFAAIHCTTIGISHVVQAKSWAEFFIWLRAKGNAGIFVNGFLSLGFGAFIAAFHNVWTGLPIILTVLGWAQVLKGFLSFVAPQLARRSLDRVSIEQSWKFQVPGAVIFLLGLLLWYLALSN